MTDENVELARRGYDAFLGGDLMNVLQMMHPEFSIQLPPGLPGARKYHGHDGFLEAVREQLEAFEETSLEPEEFIGINDHVVALIHQRGRGRASGVEVNVNTAWVWTILDGKAVNLQIYLDRKKALESVGLSEPRQSNGAGDRPEAADSSARDS